MTKVIRSDRGLCHCDVARRMVAETFIHLTQCSARCHDIVVLVLCRVPVPVSTLLMCKAMTVTNFFSFYMHSKLPRISS
jgi:hypothetical protein